jgi:hypothetical protein
MKQSQGLGLLRFARNDCKYFCPTTYQFSVKLRFIPLSREIPGAKQTRAYLRGHS